MTRDPLSSWADTLAATPQTKPVPGRTDMVKNPAGGYIFEKSDWDKVEDFLILGTTGGAYYLGKDELTAQNAEVIIRMAKAHGAELVKLATEISTSIPPRAPRNRPALFALAAVSAFGDPAGVQAVKEALPQVARTTDHLAQFFGYRKQLKNKRTTKGIAPMASRAYRTALSNWFLTADVNDVAFRACKARQRKTPAGEAFDLRDAVRIAHPATQDEARVMLLRWLSGKATDEEAARVLPAVDNFMTAKAVTSPAQAVRVITERRVPWEFLPSEVLSSKEVWNALVHTTGLTAVLRNLARMTRIGTLGTFTEANATVIRRLTNPEAVLRARIHPMDAYLALRVYKSGRAQPDPRADVQQWKPVADILDALEVTYELAFGTVQPSGRKILVAVDSSGSMRMADVSFGGASLGSAYEVGCAVALIMKRIEGANVHVIDVDTAARESKITARTNLRELSHWIPSGGGTDLSLPMQYAMQYDLRVDGFALLTDNMTWAGKSHPFQVLEDYRRRYNPRARFADITMIPYGHSVADPMATGVINMAGMDASLPTVLSGFFRSE